MKNQLPAKFVFVSFLVSIMLLGYQNCAPANFDKAPVSIDQPSVQAIVSVTTTTLPPNVPTTVSISTTTTVPTTPPRDCTFNGRTIRHGEKTTGYQYENVPSGQACTPHELTCSDGNIPGSGIYTYDSCAVAAAAVKPGPGIYGDCGTVKIGDQGVCQLKPNTLVEETFSADDVNIDVIGAEGNAPVGTYLPGGHMIMAYSQYAAFGTKTFNWVVRAHDNAVAGTYFYVKISSTAHPDKIVYLKITIVP